MVDEISLMHDPAIVDVLQYCILPPLHIERKIRPNVCILHHQGIAILLLQLQDIMLAFHIHLLIDKSLQMIS